MKLLAVVTDNRRPGICPKCSGACEYVQLEVRAAGPERVRGVFWKPAEHTCSPVQAQPLHEVPDHFRHQVAAFIGDKKPGGAA